MTKKQEQKNITLAKKESLTQILTAGPRIPPPLLTVCTQLVDRSALNSTTLELNKTGNVDPFCDAGTMLQFYFILFYLLCLLSPS